MHWNTAEIKKLIAQPGATVTRARQGGDYDTTNLVVVHPDWRYFVVGFRPEESITAAELDDCADVDAISVGDGQDSRGGCNSSDEGAILAHARIVAALRGAGWETIGHYDEIF